MNLIEKIRIIERTDALIRRKSTGTPKQLAEKLKVSESYIFKLISLMKEMGAPIYYCDDKFSYCYEYEVEFSIGFMNKLDNFENIKGGTAKNIDFFMPLYEF